MVNEIAGYAIEGAKWAAAAGVITYTAVMLSNPASMVLSQKIKSQQELESVVKEEESKLGLNTVKCSFLGEPVATSYIDEANNLKIELGGAFATKSNVRHELYHHYKGDTLETEHNLKNNLKYWMVYEPRACLYQSTRIKL